MNIKKKYLIFIHFIAIMFYSINSKILIEIFVVNFKEENIFQKFVLKFKLSIILSQDLKDGTVEENINLQSYKQIPFIKGRFLY